MMIHLVFAILATATATPWIPEGKLNDTHWMELHEEYKHSSATNGKNISVVFLGDSITMAWHGRAAGKPVFDSKYVPLGSAAYGIGGDKTENLLFRIADGEVDHMNPKVVVIMIGTNNKDSADDIVRGIRAIVDLLLERLPSTKIILMGILPHHGGDSPFIKVSDINIKISKFADRDRVHFLDMFDQFSAAWGVRDEVLYEDSVHLNTAGYQKWADTMEFLFNKLMSA